MEKIDKKNTSYQFHYRFGTGMYVHCTVLPPSQIIRRFVFSRYSPFFFKCRIWFWEKVANKCRILVWPHAWFVEPGVKETHRSFHAQLNPHAAMPALACMLPVKYYAQVAGGTLVSAARAWLAWSHAGVIA
jgi:hypothetical protein